MVIAVFNWKIIMNTFLHYTPTLLILIYYAVTTI